MWQSVSLNDLNQNWKCKKWTPKIINSSKTPKPSKCIFENSILEHLFDQHKCKKPKKINLELGQNNSPKNVQHIFDIDNLENNWFTPETENSDQIGKFLNNITNIQTKFRANYKNPLQTKFWFIRIFSSNFSSTKFIPNWENVFQKNLTSLRILSSNFLYQILSEVEKSIFDKLRQCWEYSRELFSYKILSKVEKLFFLNWHSW